MKSFQTFLTEAITDADVVKFRQDAGAFSKNIRRIQSPEQLARVANAFRIWRAYAESLIFYRLLGLRDDYDFRDEPYLSKVTRERMAPIFGIGTLDDIFLPRPRASGYIADRELRDNTGAFAYTPKTAPHWDRIYREFDRQRESAYAKFGRYVREGFKALDAFMLGKNQRAPDHALTSTHTINGIPVTLIGSETSDSQYHVQPRHALQMLQRTTDLIKAHGLGSALVGLTLTVYLTQLSYDLPAGTYGGNHIDIHTLGVNAHTIAHEIGHHFYYRLPKARVIGWERFIKQQKLTFEPEELTTIRRAYDDAFDHASRTTGTYGYTITDMWSTLIPRRLTGLTRAKYLHFMTAFSKPSRRRFVLDPFLDGRDRAEKFQAFADATRGTFLMFASEYSNKNADEAYAEAFAEYTTDEHPLADVMRTMFEYLSGLR